MPFDAAFAQIEASPKKATTKGQYATVEEAAEAKNAPLISLLKKLNVKAILPQK